MEPQIHYARTADGVNIAYSTLGSGPPLFQLGTTPAVFSMQFEWEIPEWRAWHERLSRNHTVVRYDARGAGLSDRDVADLSLDALVSDVEAVVAHANLAPFDLFGMARAGLVAAGYAARHPEGLNHLVLWCTMARGRDYTAQPTVQSLLAVLDTEWEFYTEALAHALFGFAEGTPARQVAALMRKHTTLEQFKSSLAAFDRIDVSSLLPSISAPTLVLHRQDVRMIPLTLAHELTQRISGASLTVLSGASVVPFLDEPEVALRVVEEFLGYQVYTPTPAAAVHTILFTDLEASTALTNHLGDAKAQELLHLHDEAVRAALQTYGGHEIKHTGDGIMASFASAARAVECAVAVQRKLVGVEPLRVKMGLNAGEPIAEHEDIFGTSVQLARRVCDCAGGGEILATNVVRELCSGKGLPFADRGITSLKGFDEPAHLYEVRWRD